MLTVPTHASAGPPSRWDENNEPLWEFNPDCRCRRCNQSRTAREVKAKRDAAPTALYRLYDDDGVMLYVGITRRRPDDRFAEHATNAWWWPYVARQVVDWYPDRITARAREKAWVQTGLPLINKTELDMHGKAKQEERQRRYRLARGDA